LATNICDSVAKLPSGVNKKVLRHQEMKQPEQAFELPIPPGFEIVFRPWKIDPKTGRKIYPKRARVFRMLVKKRS